MTHERWPSLPLDEWEPTYRTLHRYSQVIGKLRLALCAPINHWWHVALRYGARGLTTTPMPIGDGRQLEIAFDFVDHALVFSTSGGERRSLPLVPRSVADFYRAVRDELTRLGVEVRIWPVPVELTDSVPFAEDTANASYDRAAVDRMWRILASLYPVFTEFRGRFLGKSSPVHFFWGSFDLALTRFSGRRNPDPPEHPVMREAYSHEVISHGFWFGGDWPVGGTFRDPVVYAYATPQPDGFDRAPVRPAEGGFSRDLGEFVLPYSELRRLRDPEAAMLDFMQSTYEAGAAHGRWDRATLERPR